MRHEDYVNSLIATDNLMELRLMAARATQEFDALIATLMEQRGFELDDLSGLTGVATERLQHLLDGDSPDLEETLLLCHALGLDLLLDSSFHLYPHRRAEGDPFLRALANAPEDDEPETPEEAADVAEAKAEIERGEFTTLEEIRAKYLGQDSNSL